MKYQVRSNSDVVPGNIHTSSFFVSGEHGVHPSFFVITTNGSENMKLVPTNSKLSPTQEKTQALVAEIKVKLKLMLSEPSRNLTATPENRAKVERMVKGAAVQYGPRLNQPADANRVYKFDAARLMYQLRTELVEGLDLDEFLSSGEQYQGETHLCVLVSWDSFLLVVKRILLGLVGPGKKATQAEHLKLCFDLARVLRHVETFSCWREEGVNEYTGETFLFNWPKEQAKFPNNFYSLAVQERAYAIDDVNSFGLKWRARPVLEEDEAQNFDDATHPADAKRRTAKKRNKDVKELGSFIGE